MAEMVTMPKLGLTMERGVVGAWRINEGDQVSLGAVIAEINTEKITYDLEAQTEGVVLKILVPEDGEVEVGAAIAVIGQPGEDIATFGGGLSGTAAHLAPELSTASDAVPEADSLRASTGRILASPAAKKMAAGLGLDITTVAGTGPGGRITLADVTATAPKAVPAAEPLATPAAKKLAAELSVDLASAASSGPSGRIRAEDVMRAASQVLAASSPESADLRGETAKEIRYVGMRRTIGERMDASLRLTAGVTYSSSADVHDLREMLNLAIARMPGFTPAIDGDVVLLAAIVKAAALTLEKMPRFNATLDGDTIKVWKHINVGVAVALSKGLIVPNVKEANRKTVSQIAREIREVAERARDNRLLPDDVSGGTFTVTTIGPYGSVDFFTPVINLPEAAILGVGRMRDAVVAVDHMPVVRATLGLSLTSDHRMLDGGPSAEFLGMLTSYLSEPLSLFV